ncbi:MAG: hypothetical protein E7481_06860 [Ruminococcaceae bacterium]|nr:hypothetical protein [Oscillospiraceae bacterium]
MKKTALFLLTLATAATMTSCVKVDVQGDIEPKEPEVSMGGMMGGMQLTNPIKTYENGEEISEILGFTVVPLPESENIVFSTISDDVAQVKFTNNGIEYTLRANDDSGDFSGVYTSVVSENTDEILLSDNTSVSVQTKTLTDGNTLIFWSNSENTIHYSLYIEGTPENISETIFSVLQNNNSEMHDYNGTVKDVDFDFNCIRTNAMYENKTHYPYAVVISSKEELDSYYETNKNAYYLERVEKVYSDTTIGFLDEADKYDESFFEENSLIFVVTENGSGSIRHSVKKVEISDMNTVITIKNTVPEICTADMANWHIFISVSKEDTVPNKIEIVFE